MKGKPLFQKSLAWIERLNDYPGCDRKELTVKVQLWVGTAYALLHVLLLTTAFLIFAPEALKILIGYGYFLAIVLTINLMPLRISYKLVNAIKLSILMAGTFYFILYLGGIATSGGLIVVCLTMLLSSVPLQDSKISLLLFSLFTFIVIISGLFSSFFSAPASLTPKINSILFMINTLSMSGLALFLILSFIAQQRKLEELESEKLKELNEAKNKLFTNITHEFRTPLTVIQGMANLIEKNPQEWLKEGTAKIRSNSNILLNLVNQMLDLAKIETGVMQTHSVQSDINAYIGYVTELFRSLADSRSISLQYLTPGDMLVMDFDPDKLLHILSNLLSNALKFTPEGGNVEVSTSVDEAKKLFTIRITDTGIGIEPEHLSYIFDRFYRVENSIRNPNGTGLGLALAKEMTELIGGNLSVESQLSKGTSFLVKLSLSHDAPIESSSIFEINKEQGTSLLSFNNQTNTVLEQTIHYNKALPLLLIVEDSNDVSHYLAAILKNEYRIDHAENGKIGLEKALDRIPDIILSDVMMPEMDGISMLEKVKNDIRTSHIPVVMLTAKADITSRISGLERGADAYLAKPFEEKELHIILKNLVEIRKKLHERYASPEDFPPLPENGYKIEDAFMGKVKQVLEANLDNDEYVISQLCRELAVSHTQLYRKFKSVCNQTIAEYFKVLRLNKSRALLTSTSMNVTEVAFAAGFKNLSYFSREFSAKFGTNPLEFRKKTNLERSANK